MARYKYIDTSPRLIAFDLERQPLPGTFEHTLNHLVDNNRVTIKIDHESLSRHSLPRTVRTIAAPPVPTFLCEPEKSALATRRTGSRYR